MLTAQRMWHTVIAVPDVYLRRHHMRSWHTSKAILWQMSRGCRLWLQCGGKIRTATPHCLHYSVTCTDKCKSWLSNYRTTALFFEGLACAAKCFRYLTKWPSAFYLDVPCVECVQCTLCSVTGLVRCFLRQPLVPCWSVLPQFENKTENPSPPSLFTFHVFAQLSHLIEVCCSYVTSSCKYTLFSFLKGVRKRSDC